MTAEEETAVVDVWPEGRCVTCALPFLACRSCPHCAHHLLDPNMRLNTAHARVVVAP
jgi:hypothetical protein